MNKKTIADEDIINFNLLTKQTVCDKLSMNYFWYTEIFLTKKFLLMLSGCTNSERTDKNIKMGQEEKSW